jgi:hypothetical protein
MLRIKEESPKGNQRILLKDRDYRLLRVMSEQMCLSMDQIRRHFFCGASDSPAYRRIQKLSSFGLVRKLSFLSPSGSSIWAPTELGRSYGLSGCHYTVQAASGINQNELMHTLEMTEARFALENLWSGIFYSEATLSDLRWKHKPDAVFQFSNNELLPIELERSSKGYRKLKEILSIWERSEGVQNVLYIAGSAELERVILNTAKQVPESRRVIVTTLEKISSSYPHGESITGQLDLRVLGGLRVA